MRVKRPQELGRFPAAEVARQLLLAHLDAAAEAHRRLARHTDADALHDFRVALRRLRSVLRAPIGDNSRPCPKTPQALAGARPTTNAGRDAEVQLEWLRRQKNIPAMERAGYEWFRRRLERARNRAYTDIRRDVPVYFSAIEETCARHYARSLPPRLDRTQRRRPVCSWTTARGSAGNWRASVRSPTRTKSTARVLRASACVTFSSRWPRNSAAQSGPSSP